MSIFPANAKKTIAPSKSNESIFPAKATGSIFPSKTTGSIFPSKANESSSSSYKQVIIDDLKRGKRIIEQRIPIAKQKIIDYHHNRVTTDEAYRKVIITKDYRHGTQSSEDAKIEKRVTEDGRRGIKTTEERESRNVAIFDYNGKQVGNKQSHHSSKTSAPIKSTNYHIDYKGKKY